MKGVEGSRRRGGLSTPTVVRALKIYPGDSGSFLLGSAWRSLTQYVTGGWLDVVGLGSPSCGQRVPSPRAFPQSGSCQLSCPAKSAGAELRKGKQSQAKLSQEKRSQPKLGAAKQNQAKLRRANLRKSNQAHAWLGKSIHS